ncbi:MAG: hypothetical protein JSV31_10015 [Desulfobacterales bacterium]|nr:MAG: hypothetical protein JSV31_10015 [Desulfobacterales bacterium]
MTTLNLTTKDILSDIEGFKERIYKAQQKLQILPKNSPGPQERKRMKFKRRILEQEIDHVKRLIRIAKEALGEMEQ